MRRAITALTMLAACAAGHGGEVQWWLSSEDGAARLNAQQPLAWERPQDADAPDIAVDESRRFQSILGLGGSLEPATCYNISQLPPAQREEVIRRLVDPEEGIGISLMRLCIGTPDFTGDPWYSYADLPAREVDPELKSFNIGKDRVYILPVIKQALAAAPDLKFFASVWSPPGWMKTEGSMLGGKLRPEYREAFSRYLVKFVKAYEAEGVPVMALTPQNEPYFPNPEYPTTYYDVDDMQALIKVLGPIMEAEIPQVELWCWDHNWNRPEYPAALLEDPEVARFIDGTAFHLYEGRVEAQSQLHAQFPDSPIYFTEGSTFRTRGAVQIIQILRHWARGYNAWVMMLDEDRKPNNGPHDADRTCIELMRDGTVQYHFDYFMYGHFTKFIRPGAVRVASSEGNERLANVAFKSPDGATVMVVANAGAAERPVRIGQGDREIRLTLPRRSLATLVWRSE
jgi:beta-glucosidase